jgi:hypothetical protein
MDILGPFVIAWKMEGFFRKVAEITAERHVPCESLWCEQMGAGFKNSD